MAEIIDKLVGETPLEALERFRLGKINAKKRENDAESASILGTHSWKDAPLTYAGRLDPMAEGKLLILIGEECKDKEKYLGLDKEYEVEIVLGLETDTYDALGIVEQLSSNSNRFMINGDTVHVGNEVIDQEWLRKYVGKFDQQYPAYSSKTVNGKQLHELARSGNLPSADEMPTKKVEIYEIELLSAAEISAEELLTRITKNIDMVKGDFRQEDIKNQWLVKLTKNSSTINVEKNVHGEGLITCSEASTQIGGIGFPLINIRVKCSSGTYMRSLAHRIGHDLGTGAFALGIKRTKLCTE